MAATERRRNLRTENCRGCGTTCEAGAGYLYRDTATMRGRQRHRQRHRQTGRWGWFVKCERCHTGETAKAARKPAAPRWSVRDVAKWSVELGQVTRASVLSDKPGTAVGSYRYGQPSIAIQRGDADFEWRWVRLDLSLPVVGDGWAWSQPVCWVLAGGARETVASEDYRGVFRAHPLNEGDSVLGRELTEKAAELLAERVRAAVAAYTLTD